MDNKLDFALFRQRGFLPEADPLPAFPLDSPYAVLDDWGAQLPAWLEQADFRRRARELAVPEWREPLSADTVPMLRLYYLRVGFLASGYINQVGQAPVALLPANLAMPLCRACELLGRPPILSYDGYALYNWRRLDPAGPVALGNIDTLQNFVTLYDEHWFILVHVEIEALAANALDAILELADSGRFDDAGAVNAAITRITDSLRAQRTVLARIPEKMSPELYYRTFRPYIRFFENVVYEGVQREAMNFRGETGAQSSVLPSLVAFFKIDHQPTMLTDHLHDMRRYMPAPHRALIEFIEALPAVKPAADAAVFNAAMDALADFRELHYEWARRYIDDKVDDPRGTGGTPYMQWLAQLIRETRAFCK